MNEKQIVGSELEEIAQRLNLIYNHFMYLKIFVDSKDEKLHEMYKETVEKHNQKIIKNPEMIDAGFDLFTPSQENEININTKKETEEQKIILHEHTPKKIKPYTLDFKVICSAQMVTDTNKVYNYTGI